MARFRFLDKKNKGSLPKTSGVYLFKSAKEFLYIGKATNIRERVKSHFQQPGFRDNLFISKVKKIGYLKTESEIEALLREAELIKKLRTGEIGRRRTSELWEVKFLGEGYTIPRWILVGNAPC